MLLSKSLADADSPCAVVKQNSDPDFEASSMGLSLKDPVRRSQFRSIRIADDRLRQLTLARIKVPIRSISCNHVSCFDASTFLMINEQTPSWKCPICSNVLRYEDLAVDGSVPSFFLFFPG